MKSVLKAIIIFMSFLAFGMNAKAATASLEVDKEKVTVGETFKASVNVDSSAAWNIHVSSTGPVSGCKIDEADTTAQATDENKKISIDCKADKVGTITLNLTGDVTSVTDGNAVDVNDSVKVTVVSKVENLKPENPKTGLIAPGTVLIVIVIIGIILYFKFNKKNVLK